VRPTRPADPPQTFLSALHIKYDHAPSAPARQVVISGKVAEEVGFDKIRRKQAQLSELKIVILDGSQVVSAGKQDGQSIRDVCPQVTDLDLSRNLFIRFETVVDICSELQLLKTLRVK
jgi:hypothetical protein